MSSISKNDQLSARISVKVPRPDSLVEVRVTPPDSNFQVKVSPGDEVIELLIRPGASMVEVRISPPGQAEEDECGPFGGSGPKSGAQSPAEEEVVPGLSKAEFAAILEEEESAEAKKLLDRMAEDEESARGRDAPPDRLPDEAGPEPGPDRAPAVAAAPEEAAAPEMLPEQALEASPQTPEPAPRGKPEDDDEPAVAGPAPGELAAASNDMASAGPDEFDRPEAEEPVAGGPASDPVPASAPVPADSVRTEPDEFDFPGLEEPGADLPDEPGEPDEFDRPDGEDFFGQLTLEDDEAPVPVKAPAPAEQAASAGQTLEWVPVNPNGVPVEEDNEPIAPEVIGAAAFDALARLNQAVLEEKAAIAAASRPEENFRPGETTAAAASLSSADSTIMVEMYEDYEPGPNPADTATPPPEDELMDLSQVEKDEDLAIDPIDVDGLGELDLEKSHFAESRNGKAAVKARPMIQVIPGNTVVPE